MEELKRKARALHALGMFNVNTSNEWRALATYSEAKRAPKFLNWTGRNNDK